MFGQLTEDGTAPVWTEIELKSRTEESRMVKIDRRSSSIMNVGGSRRIIVARCDRFVSSLSML